MSVYIRAAPAHCTAPLTFPIGSLSELIQPRPGQDLLAFRAILQLIRLCSTLRWWCRRQVESSEFGKDGLEDSVELWGAQGVSVEREVEMSCWSNVQRR